jgi:hypothetical protein
MDSPVLDCLGRQMINGAVYNPATTRTATCTGWFDRSGPRSVPEQLHRRAQHLGSGGAGGSSLHSYSIGATADALNNNYPNLQPNNKYQYLTSIKIDHSIGEKWHLSGYYIHEISNKDNAADGINGTAAQTRWNTTPAPQVYLNADFTATPNLVLHAGFDFTRHNAAQDAFVQNFKASTLGLNTAANMPGGAANTFPIIYGLTTNRQEFLSWEITTLRFRRQLVSHWIRDLDPRQPYVQIWRRSPSSGIWHSQRPIGRKLRLQWRSDVSAVRQGQNLYGSQPRRWFRELRSWPIGWRKYRER